MGSRLDARSFATATAAVALAGAALYLSRGLSPQWWAVWVAALPVLWIAPRLSRGAALAVAGSAGLIGGLGMWGYYTRLQLPLWLRLAEVIVPAAVFCGAVALFRGFLRRERLWLAAAAFPAVMIAYEYVTSLGFGTFGATGYTQLANLPVLQVAALAGLWGVGFVVWLFSSMVAAIFLSPVKQRRGLTIGAVVIFGGTLGYGALRLWMTPAAPHTVVVGLAVSDLPQNTLPQKDEDAIRLLKGYAEQAKLLAARGARIVVLPEMTALVRDTISGEVDEVYRQTTRGANAQILLGVLHATSKGTFNEARLYSESGAPQVVYRKQHLVPVLEGRTTPAHDISVVEQPIGTLGLEICRDMDYPDPAQRYGKARAGLVLVPAWDFDVDRYWHGHMAIVRGVENGFTVVRAAKQGLLTVSDDRGRVLSEKRTTPNEPFTTMIAAVPVRHGWTLYQAWGDWFGWLCVALAVGFSALRVRFRALR